VTGLPSSSGRCAAGTLLRAGAAPLLAVGVVIVALASVQGARAGAGALVGTAVAGAAMAVGPCTLHLVRSGPPVAVMAAAVGAYGALVVGLGLLWALLTRIDRLSAEHLGLALIAGVVAWSAGQVRATARLRTPYFEVDRGERGQAVARGEEGDDGQEKGS